MIKYYNICFKQQLLNKLWVIEDLILKELHKIYKKMMNISKNGLI